MPGMVPASLADLHRLLNNMLRLGTVAQVDHAAVRVRVKSGELTTTWLPWPAARAGDVRTWSPPSVGEQVLLLAPGGDLAQAVVMLGINSSAHPAPSSSPHVTLAHYPDGAVISYDHQAHALVATLPAGGTAELTAPGSVTVHSPSITLDAAQTTCTGKLTVQGLLSYQGGMAGKAGAGGGAAATIQGTLAATVDVTANGISLAGHKHGGVQGGGSTTAGPQ